MTDNEFPNDAVEMVRAIRDRHYEETKHMTREEMREYDKKRLGKSIAELNVLRANAKPDPNRFPFLFKK